MRAINDRVILVTGATDGLGKKVARDLAARGATMLLHGRDPRKGEAAIKAIRDATGNEKLKYYNADLASLDAVKKLANSVQADHDRLDVLINNAGIGAGPETGAPREESAEGHELRLAVNYLAPVLLTHQLLPLLRRSAPARIVNVASVGQEPIDFDDVMLEKTYDGMRAYRQSKLAQVMFTFDLAKDLEESGVTVNALHPATLMDTNMVREGWGSTMSTVREGAEAVEHLATSSELDGVTGEYFDGKKPAQADAQAYDEQARRQLRRLSEQLTGINEARG